MSSLYCLGKQAFVSLKSFNAAVALSAANLGSYVDLDSLGPFWPHLENCK